MDPDFLLKVIPVLVGIVSAIKPFHDFISNARGRMREEYKFASDFLGAIEKNQSMHPYLREKGYQAIAGDSTLEADVIEYILTLRSADRALKDYTLGRSYLDHLPHAGNLQIAFKRQYQATWKRWLLIAFYGVLYFTLAMAAVSPFILGGFFPMKGAEMFISTMFTSVMFGPSAWLSLKSSVRIYRAQMLVDHQHKHTQRIVIPAGAKGVTAVR